MKNIREAQNYLPFRSLNARTRTALLFVFLCLLFGLWMPALGAERLSLPVFPGAQGFGTDTPAGRGGEIFKVKNLNDSGPGSLRAALEAKKPRIIVFEVGGDIFLSRPLRIVSPFVTVAGQTAPSPGITLRGGGVTVKTHDVLIQHLRIRVGDDPCGPPPDDRDALKILGPETYNVVIDHVSASWAIDENISTWYGPHDVTISNSIVSEGLHESLKKNSHSKGILVGDRTANVSLIGNLMAHNAGRNPRIKGGSTGLVVNNIAYNSSEYAWMEVGSDDGPALVSAIGNLFIDGPNTSAKKTFLVKKGAPPGTQLYLADNRTQRESFTYSTAFDPSVASPPVWHPSIKVRGSGEVESWVLSNAGARPMDRDPVDARIIDEVKARKGKIINSQEDVGGWPVLKPTFRPFTVPDFPHEDHDGDGYTNMEEVLHRIAWEVEGRINFEP